MGSKGKYFEPSELAQKARDTLNLDKVEQICQLFHYVKGVAKGKAKPCEECNQTFDNRIKKFLMVKLRNHSRDIEEGSDKMFRKDCDSAPPGIEYTMFLSSLFGSHGIKGQGSTHPETVSAKRKCLVLCTLPSQDLKHSFPDSNPSDFPDHKVLRLMKYLMNSELTKFTTWVFKREFGLKFLQ